MGYDICYSNQPLALDPALTPEQSCYLTALLEEDRYPLSGEYLERALAAPDPLREAVGLPAGVAGELLTNNFNTGATMRREGIPLPSWRAWTTPRTFPEGYRRPQPDAPFTVDDSRWQQGIVAAREGDLRDPPALMADWLRYIYSTILEPWGVSFERGAIHWSGEDNTDLGFIYVLRNRVWMMPAEVVYPEPEEWTRALELESQTG